MHEFAADAPPVKTATSRSTLGAWRGPIINLVRLLLLFGLLAGWELASGRLIDPFFVSAPTAIGLKLLAWGKSGLLLDATFYTLSATTLGFLLGALCGFTLGVVLARSPFLADVLQPFITAIYCLPKVALAPLFVMWFGIGLESKVAMVAMIVFFLVFLNTFSGVKDVSREYIRSLQLMGGSQMQILRHVLIPSATAWVIAGLQISVPYSLIGAVVGEMVSSNRGLGFLISQSAGVFDTAGVFASLATLVIIGIVVNSLLHVLERRLLRWR